MTTNADKLAFIRPMLTQEEVEARAAVTAELHKRAFNLWEAHSGDYLQPLDGRKAVVKAIVNSAEADALPYFLDVRGRRINRNQFNVLYLDPRRYYNFHYLKFYTSLSTVWLLILNDAAGYVTMPNPEVREVRRNLPNDSAKLYIPTNSLTWVSDELFDEFFGHPNIVHEYDIKESESYSR